MPLQAVRGPRVEELVKEFAAVTADLAGLARDIRRQDREESEGTRVS